VFRPPVHHSVAVTSGQILLVLVASAAGAWVKGVTGLGYPLLAVPLIALGTGVENAVVIVAFPNLAANAYLCWEARLGRGESRDLPRLVVAGVVGAVLGTLALLQLPETPLLLALAVTILVFSVLFLRHPELRMAEATSHRWSPVAGFTSGIMQGAVGVSGPVVATWLHGYRLTKTAYVFSVTLIFGVTGAVQVGVLATQGAFTVDRLQASAVALAAVVVMIPLGLSLRERLAGPTFERAVLGVLVVSAVALLYRVWG